jgi:phenylacetate-CoA ligase
MIDLHKLYHSLPAPCRGLVASARGLHLRRWRYGGDTSAMVDAALERESWTSDRWQAWRAERLQSLLSRAASRVPHYRAVWDGRRTTVHGPTEQLDHWPVLPKEALRSAPRQFLADGCDPRRMFHEHTSGTTGKPLDLWWSRATVRAWYALFEARVRRWNGVTRADRWAMLGGQLVVPSRQSRPPYWVLNRGMNQLYMSSYHLGPGTVGAYLAALAERRVRYLFGYASSLYSLAQLAHEAGLEAPRMAVAISNAEPLLEHQRVRIAQVFGCPVRNTYGMAEIVAAGSECAEGVMHEWPEVGVIEVLRDDADEPVAPGQVGRIVATGLLNPDMPLIRYDTGDRGRLSAASGPCACGRFLPALADVEGRCDDVVITADGLRVGRLDPVFKRALAIREAQIIQEELGRIRVKVVAAEGFGERDVEAIRDGLRERLGPRMEIVFERVDRIARTSAGKFRAVVSELPRVEPRPDRAAS